MERCTTTVAHRIQVIRTRRRERAWESAMPPLGMYPEHAHCTKLSTQQCSCSPLPKSKTWTCRPCPQTGDGIRKRVSMYTRQHDAATTRRPTPPTNTKKHGLGSHRDGKKNSWTQRHRSRSEREIPWETPSLWNLPKDTKEPLYRKETRELENRCAVAGLEGEGVGRPGMRRVENPTS